MVDSVWVGGKQAVHLGTHDAMARRLERQAREADVSIVRLDLRGITDGPALCSRLSEVFMFPHETVGLDAAIDLISDLEWFGSEHGYLVVVTGVPGLPAPVVRDLAGILPNILDRWRAQGTFFVVLIDDEGPELTVGLRHANEQLTKAGRLPWAQSGTGPVTVVLSDGSVST